MKGALLILGRGIGQVMFQNNALSGLLMLVGVLLNSWQMALLAIAGNVVSTLAAYFSGYSREDIRNGLYGFNGTLVGIAIGVFMPITVASLLLLVAGSCLSTWIARLFGLQRLVSGFTAPFIISVWILLVTCNWMMPSLLLPSGDAVTAQAVSFYRLLSEYRSGNVSGKYCVGRGVLSAGYLGEFPYQWSLYHTGGIASHSLRSAAWSGLCRSECWIDGV